MSLENAIIVRVCHDLITPFNAISLGLEAFEASGDKSLINGMSDSARKANAILKFIRDLHAQQSDDFCYHTVSLKRTVGEFLKNYNINFDLQSRYENIPHLGGKIIMYSAFLAKESMPYGGDAICKIDETSNAIMLTISGKNISDPDITKDEEVNHKNVMRYCLINLLQNNGFEIFAYNKDDSIEIVFQKIIR